MLINDKHDIYHGEKALKEAAGDLSIMPPFSDCDYREALGLDEIAFCAEDKFGIFVLNTADVTTAHPTWMKLLEFVKPKA